MRSTNTSFYIKLASIALVQVSLINTPVAAGVLQGRVEHSSEPPKAAYVEKLEVSAQDSFPIAYEGKWQCVTTVTDSAVTDVIPGTVTQCQVEFKKEKDGRILAHCEQAGWTEAQNTVISFSKTEAQMDRTAYFLADGAGGAWATRSRDSFTLTSANNIVSNSYIDQYYDGRYLGRYKTNSVLTKADAAPTTAMLFQQ